MEIAEYKSYQEYKTELDTELAKTAEGFVRIGYLLKVARDTNILEESGYKSMAEFAQAEYGLSKDIVSRYVAINDKYSEGGYSDRLAEQYQDYGYAKLAEMLTLPPGVTEALHPELTKEDIRTIKAELKEEEKISDIELMLEKKETEGKSMTQQALLKYLEEDIEAFKALCTLSDAAGFNKEKLKQMSEALAPSEIAMHMVRVPGVGRLLISIRGREQDIEVVNSRSGDKDTLSWEELYGVIDRIFQDFTEEDAGDRYKAIYNHDMPEKQEVAPAQPHWPAKDKKKKAKSKVTVPKKPEPVKKEVPKVEDNVHQNEQAETEVLEGTVEESEKQIAEQESEEPTVSEESDKAAGREGVEAEIVANNGLNFIEGTAGQQVPEKQKWKDEQMDIVKEDTSPGTMSEDDLKTLWEEIEELRDKVVLFIDDTVEYSVIAGMVYVDDIKKAYDNAVSLAAGLEMLLLDTKKRIEQERT